MLYLTFRHYIVSDIFSVLSESILRKFYAQWFLHFVFMFLHIRNSVSTSKCAINSLHKGLAKLTRPRPSTTKIENRMRPDVHA